MNIYLDPLDAQLRVVNQLLREMMSEQEVHRPEDVVATAGVRPRTLPVTRWYRHIGAHEHTRI